MLKPNSHLKRAALDRINKQLIELLLSKRPNNITHQPLIISVVGAGGKTHLVYWLAALFKAHGHQVCVSTTTKMYLPSADKFERILTFASYDKSYQALDVQTLNPAPQCTFIYQEQIHSAQPYEELTEQEAPEKTEHETPKQAKQEIPDKTKVKGLSFAQVATLASSKKFSVIILEADGAKGKAIKAPAAHEPCIMPSSDLVFSITGAEMIFSPAKPSQIQRWQEFRALTACQEGMRIDQQVLKPLINQAHGMFKDAPKQALKFWVINKLDLSSDQDALLALATQLLNESPLLDGVCLMQLQAANPLKNLLIKKNKRILSTC